MQVFYTKYGRNFLFFLQMRTKACIKSNKKSKYIFKHAGIYNFMQNI